MKPRDVSLTITADTSQLIRELERARLAILRMHKAFESPIPWTPHNWYATSERAPR